MSNRRHEAPFLLSDFTRPFFEKGYAKGLAKGYAKGLAKAAMALLRSRGLSISPDAQNRITSCTDRDQLEHWIDLAVTVDRTEDLFAAEQEPCVGARHANT